MGELVRLHKHLPEEVDSEFFAARPHRSYRIRRSLPAEIRLNALQDESSTKGLIPGWAWWTVIRQYKPGTRFHLFVYALDDFDPDPPEDDCRLIWETKLARFHRMQKIDAMLEAAATRRLQ